MPELIVDIFQPVQIQIAEDGLPFFLEDVIHVFFKKETVFNACSGIVVCFARKVFGSLLFLGDIDSDMHVGRMLLPINRERGDAVMGLFCVVDFPYVVLLRTAPVDELRVEGKLAFAGAAVVFSCFCMFVFLVAVQHFPCILVYNQQPFVPLAEHFHQQFIETFCHVQMCFCLVGLVCKL